MNCALFMVVFADYRCPKCVELKLRREGAAFCSQECFKASWSSHKFVHLNAKSSLIASESYSEQNLGLPGDGWLYCLIEGQAQTPKLPHFDWTGPLRPYPMSQKRIVPTHIDQPDN
ncbi:methionine aminopeptidase 1A-like [Salvia miltiorrhiza]|uniref:methionine aminopeptidase 1A-like n=1 Tax=Salvia miltiorrhiza TaxID=226208 RepID=UPI0025AD4551|nr:methionine aminopeptidase 1A-like [Salvia miltiorrhiza]